MIRIRPGIVVMLLAVTTMCMTVDSDTAAAQSAPPGSIGTPVNLQAVPSPDLAGVAPAVRKQIHDAQAAVARALSSTNTDSSRRAETFGSLGQIYQAYGFNNAALTCYTDAARLDSQSFRWFYYSGYLLQKNGNAESAAREYQRALTLKPTDVPALLRLGNVELTLYHLDAAKQSFAKAMTERHSSAAALTGMGKVALFQHRYGAALKYFTQALALDPRASSIHYQLAMTYRNLGDLIQMREQLKARGDVEPTIQDPLLDEISDLQDGEVGLLERARSAMREDRFADAIADWRQMVLHDPSNPLTYQYLGIAMAMAGDPDSALKQYARSLQLDPSNAGVHYDIGILLIEGQKEQQAIPQFQQALQLDPGLVAAHFQLANLLMRERKDAAAARQYGIVVSLEPQNKFARLMQAMAAVHLGSYALARALLQKDFGAFPRDSDFANALARLLAAAPEPAVRDPNLALRIVETLVNNRQGDPLEVQITLAMALAAVRRFREAAWYQQALINQLEAAGEVDLARRLRPNLVLYQQGRPCRVPWASDDPVFTPVPSTAQLPTEMKSLSAHP